MLRRTLLKKMLSFLSAVGILGKTHRCLAAQGAAVAEGYDPGRHRYGMGIQVDRCIGCNQCVDACKTENEVPAAPFYTRTWVERYVIDTNNETTVQTVGGLQESSESVAERDILRSFFVPKLCNQCDNPPCVQVCPVEATFSTADGVVLVDKERCIGCGYCIQACPYGARYMHPVTHTADKCTFCYHRVVRVFGPPAWKCVRRRPESSATWRVSPAP